MKGGGGGGVYLSQGRQKCYWLKVWHKLQGVGNRVVKLEGGFQN